MVVFENRPTPGGEERSEQAQRGGSRSIVIGRVRQDHVERALQLAQGGGEFALDHFSGQGHVGMRLDANHLGRTFLQSGFGQSARAGEQIQDARVFPVGLEGSQQRLEDFLGGRTDAFGGLRLQCTNSATFKFRRSSAILNTGHVLKSGSRASRAVASRRAKSSKS